MRRAVKWLGIIFGALAVLALAALLLFQWATRSLKDDVLRVLGPESEITALHIGLTSVTITGVRVKAPRGWPAESSLHAERVVLTPDLRQLVSRHIRVTRLAIYNGYLSAVRPREGGGLKLLPGMLGAGRKRQAEEGGRSGEIETIALDNCVVELYDTTVLGHKRLRVEGVHGTLDGLAVPKLDTPVKVNLAGAIRGKAHQGTIAVTGWINVAHKASELVTQVRNVDLGLFEPYIVRKTEQAINKGTFNLDLSTAVQNNEVMGHGELVLTGMRLKKGEGLLGSFENLPQRAVLSSMADSEDRISLPFELKGNLDNPNFSLSEKLGSHTGLALLKGLGFGFDGILRALLSLVSGLGAAF